MKLYKSIQVETVGIQNKMSSAKCVAFLAFTLLLQVNDNLFFLSFHSSSHSGMSHLGHKRNLSIAFCPVHVVRGDLGKVLKILGDYLDRSQQLTTATDIFFSTLTLIV